MSLPLQIVTETPVMADSIPSKAQEIEMLKTLPFDELIDKIVSSLVTFTINLAIAVFVFYTGKFFIGKIYKLVTKVLVRRMVDKSLSTFILSLLRMVLYFILIVTVIGILGIETSSFIALFASAGVAIGMALSGTLQNFAGGVLILLLKPYKVGDYIEAQGFGGYVTEIQIFHTIINTYDNKSIIIPNGGLSTSSINNYNREEYRRIEWPIAISYGDDVDTARKAILEIINSDSRIVKEFVEDDKRMREEEAQEAARTYKELPASGKNKGMLLRIIQGNHSKVKKKLNEWNDESATTTLRQQRLSRKPSVKVKNLGDSSVQLVARAWCNNDLYWAAFYDINERLYKELPKYGIHFPFPQLDVHMISK